MRGVFAKIACAPKNRGLAASALSYGLIISASALAQDRPSPIDPRQFERKIESQNTERARDWSSIPPTPKMVRSAPTGSHAPMFQLNGVKIQGGTSVQEDILRGIYAPYVGRPVSQADLSDLAAALTEAYRAAGYHLTRVLIPPQDVQQGIVRVQVIEGVIADIQVKGDDRNRFGVHDILAPLLNEHPSKLSTVERRLLDVSDIPGLRVVDTGINEITPESGKFRLTITVETWRVYASLGLDNSGTQAVGPWQSYGSVNFNSYLVAGDSLGVNLSTVPNSTRDLREGRLTYDAPVGRDGFRFSAAGAYSEVRPDDDRRDVNTRIDNQTYVLRGSYSAIQTRPLTINAFAALSYTDESERNDFGAVYKDRIRSLRAGLSIRSLDQLDGANYATLAFRRGLNLFNATQANDLYSSDWNAGPNFSAFEYSFTRYQQLDAGFSAKAAITGQYAFTSLFSSQQFYLGSPGFGPGYYSGDNGVSGLLELRFDKSFASDWLKNVQLYAFIDGGAAWDRNEKKEGLASAGPGVRLSLFETLNLGLAYAVSLAQTSKTAEYKNSRFLVSLSNSLKFCPDRAQMRCFSN